MRFPLAIVAIGGVLRAKGKDIREWQKILESNLWSIVPSNHYFPHAFYLSYEDLPSHLKQCFIFCSLYPEDYEFDRTTLIYLWLAEGFLRDEGGLSYYEKGIEYYKELVWRNFLQVTDTYYDQESCKMHDLLRSFAGDKRTGDSLIMRELVRRSVSFLKLRRLSNENNAMHLDFDFLSKEKSLRTLLLFNDSTSHVQSESLLIFSHLRVLNLTGSNISRLSDSFGDLVQLRYLNVGRTNLETLPNSIGNLKKLVYLNLGKCKKLSHVPSSIVNLIDLRYLSLSQTNIEVLPAGMRKLKKLNHFYNFQPCHNRSSDYSGLEDLGTMSLLSYLLLDSLEKVTDISVAKEAKLEEKVHLKDLCFSYNRNRGCQVSKPIEEKKAAENVLNTLSPPPSLEFLQIYCYFGDHLPNWLHGGENLLKLQFLRYLKIGQCECFSQLSPLGQLPNLDYLHIDGAKLVVRIGGEFLFNDSQDQTKVSQSPFLSFPQLRELIFDDMPSWEEWLWDERQPAMPKLEKLIIRNCPKLISLPKGIMCHATSLEVLKMIAVQQLKSVEDLRSVKELYVLESSNLKRISNLPNLSFIKVFSCPNLKMVENLKPHYSMELVDYEMKTLPGYLRNAEPEKLIVQCTEELLVTIANLGVGSSERQNFEHIPVVKFYSHSLYATYQKTPFRFTTNVDSSAVR